VNEAYNRLGYMYILGVLNSTHVRDLYDERVRETGRVFPQVKLEYLRKLPIPVAAPEAQAPIVELVALILERRRAAPAADISELEAEIDRMVNALYGIEAIGSHAAT
jgi:hypothetical protein